MALTERDREQFMQTVARLGEIGEAPIVLYGAGQFLRSLRPTWGTPAGVIVGVIDDRAELRGTTCAGLAVISLDEAQALGAKACIITCEGAAQDAVWAKRERLRDAGLRVLTCPRRFGGQPWDECLIEQWEVAQADARGLTPAVAYGRDYPARVHRADRRVVEALKKWSPKGGTLLEVGSGTGLLAEHLVPHAGVYHCVDFSARLLHEVIEQRFHGQRAKVRLHHDESATLRGVADASVDLAFSFDVFVHFKQDLVHQFLAAFKRVLKPGGSAVLHFAKWDAQAIATWERAMASWCVGKPDPMGYNAPEDVSASCRHLGLVMEPIDLPVDPCRWWARVGKR